MVLLGSAALAGEFGAFDAEVALHGWLTPWSDAAGTGWGVHLGADAMVIDADRTFLGAQLGLGFQGLRP